jgi:hypothetical protein
VVVVGYFYISYSSAYFGINQQQKEIAFVIPVAGLTFFISLALIICIENSTSPQSLVGLAAFNLIFEFAIGVTIAQLASRNSDIRLAIKSIQIITQQKAITMMIIIMTKISRFTTDFRLLTPSSRLCCRWSSWW